MLSKTLGYAAAAMACAKAGFLTDERRAATPYIVNCLNLNDEDLSYRMYVTQLQDRENWCRQHSPHDHEIEPLRDQGRLIGRRYRFAHESDATLFKIFFG
jgi:hypothetical protein